MRQSEINKLSNDELAEQLGATELALFEEATVDQSYSQDEVVKLASLSLDFLSALANPDGHTYNFPPTYTAIWKWLLTYVHKHRDFSKLALGMPRGFAKTALMKLFILYAVLYTDRKFILVIAANAKLATNITSDVCDFLDSPNVKATYGDWRLGLEKDTQELKKFGFRGRNIILAAIGESGSPRGLNIKNSRPDVMVFDDIQTREDADSVAVSEAIYKKMLGTTMKAKAPDGCLYLFLANMYPTPNSILRKLKHNPSWIKFIVGGILADGSSLWEELHPIQQLLEEYENDVNSGAPEIFHSEVLNDENASVNSAVDVSKIPSYSDLEHEIAAGSFIVVDPSNDKANSDLVSIGCFKVYSGVPILVDVVDARLSPGETIRESLKMAMRNNCFLIVAESNAYQYSLLYWFDIIATQLGIRGIKFEPIYSGTRSKNTRILSMFKQLMSSPAEVGIADNVRSMALNYITQFNPLRTDNVDNLLDLLTYAPRVVNEMRHLMVINGELVLEIDTISAEDSADRCAW